MQGRGIFGGSGLGAVTTGIFAGPTALGVPLSGLGASGNPCDPENDPLNPASPYYNPECGGSTGGGGASPSGACNSEAVIRYVQGQIGTGVDGKWGPLSAAALLKTGRTFQSYAPGCTGTPPGGAGSGGGGGTTSGGGGTTVVGGGGGTTTGGGTTGGGYTPVVGGGGGGGKPAGVMGMVTGETIIKGVPNWALVAGGLLVGYALYSIYQDKQGGGYEDAYASGFDY